MTHEQIDALEGRELDQAIARAFGRPVPSAPTWRSYSAYFDYALGFVPTAWGVSLDGGNDGNGWRAQVTAFDEPPTRAPSFASHGPTPAVALCRAAIKAKLAEKEK